MRRTRLQSALRASWRYLGVTLIEIMIAMVILAAGVVVIIKFQGDLLRNLGGAQQQTEALIIAENQLNTLRSYSVVESGGSGTAYDDIQSGSSTITSNATTYNVTWDVAEVSNPPYKIVTVTVQWQDSKQNTQQVNLESLIGRAEVTKSGEVMQGL